jgi:energy-coupling factor transport system permease protein
MAIEFSRDITFGQYLDLGSPIHRLDPRTKIAATSMLMVGVLLARSFASLAPILIAIVAIQLVSRIPTSYTLRGMRLLFNTMLVIFVFQVLFFPNPSEVLWRWWILSISWEGVVQGIFTLLRVLVLYYLTSTLMYTTSLVDLADGVEIALEPLKRLGIPVNELVMTMVVALKFVPLLVAELERLLKAQAARGSRFDQGNLVERARRLSSVLVPLFVGALARAEVLTVAMEARCYRGGRGRTKRRVLTFRAADALGLLFGLGFAAASIVIGRVLGL